MKHHTTSRYKRIKHALLTPPAWLGIGLAWLVLAHLPHRALLAVCDWVAALYYRFDGRGRRLALVNLRVIRGRGPAVCAGHHQPAFDVRRRAYDPTPREALVIRRSYRNMSRTIGHMFWTSRDAGRRAAAVAELSRGSSDFLAANRPCVTVSAHLGCWEVLSQLVHLAGYPMISVAKDIGTDAMTRLLMKSRRSIGQEIVSAEGAFRPLMQALKDGKDVGLLVDQVVKRKNGGIWVWFLGRPMCVSVAPAFLAAKARVPIIVAWSRPLKDGRYRCDLIDTIPWEKGLDIRATTVRVMDGLARIIRRHPSCWVLNYRYFSRGPTPEELVQLEAEKPRPGEVPVA